jgi:hypothetical protein
MALRAPSARLAAKARADIQTADVAEGSKKGSSSTTKHPRKKQKITQPSKDAETTIAVSESNAPRVDDFRRIRGRRGQLKVMTELPIDILMEIFGHVEPYDLLCLSRASKGLRSVIVGENTSTLWKKVCNHTRRIINTINLLIHKAYANVGHNRTGLQRQRPTLCPPQSNILHFTDFLFGHGCQVRALFESQNGNIQGFDCIDSFVMPQRHQLCTGELEHACVISAPLKSTFFIFIKSCCNHRSKAKYLQVDNKGLPFTESIEGSSRTKLNMLHNEAQCTKYVSRLLKLFFPSMTYNFEGARNYILQREHDRHVHELEKCANDEAKAQYKETCQQYIQENAVVSRDFKITNLTLPTHDVDYERDSSMAIKSSKGHHT